MIPGLILLAAAVAIFLPGLVQRLRKPAPAEPVWQPDLDANVAAYESMPAWMRR